MRADRSRLPPLDPAPAFRFPPIARTRLASGVRVWTVEHRAVPLLYVLVLMRSGAAADPVGREGLAALTGDLLDEGTSDLDALGFHEALGRIGAQIETEVSADATVLGLTVLTRYAERGLSLLGAMLRQPRFDASDFERVRDLRLNRLTQMRDVPQALADRAFTELLYDGHPYGHLSIGREASLRALTLDDVKAFHAQRYAAQNATIVAVGDATNAELQALVEASLGGWVAGAEATADAVTSPVREPQGRLAVLHRPGAAQSELRLGHVAIARRDPDYLPLVVLNMVLGGQFVSRLNMNLRERRGYTYGARTSVDARRGRGPFVAQASVQRDATADAIRESVREIEEIRGARPVTAEELDIGRAALTRGYARNFETAEQVARAAAQLALHDLADDYYDTFVSRVLAIDEQAVTAAAARHLQPQRLLTVVVGDRDVMGESLLTLGLGEPIALVA